MSGQCNIVHAVYYSLVSSIMVEGFFKCANVRRGRFVQLHDYEARLQSQWMKSLEKLTRL